MIRLAVAFATVVSVALVASALFADGSAHQMRAMTTHALRASASDAPGVSVRDIFPVSRKTHDGKTIPKRFAACPKTADDFDDCSWSDYGSALAMQTVPFFVLGVLTFLGWIVFLIGRFCCKCCGGAGAGRGCCCKCCSKAEEDAIFSGYKKKDVWFHKGAVIVLCVGVIIAFSIGQAANQDLNDGVTGFIPALTTHFQTKLDQLHDFATDIDGVIESLPPELQVEQLNLAKTVSDVQSQVDESLKVNDDVKSADSNRVIGTQVGLIVPMVVFLLVAVAAVFNLPKLVMPNFLCGPLMLTILFFATAVHVPLEIVTSDLCNELKSLPETVDEPFPATLEFLGQCETNTFESALDDARSVVDNALDHLCTGSGSTPGVYEELCDTPDVAFPGGATMTTVDCSSQPGVVPAPPDPDECTMDNFGGVKNVRWRNLAPYCCLTGITFDCSQTAVDNCASGGLWPDPDETKHPFISLDDCASDCADEEVRISTTETINQRTMASETVEAVDLVVEADRVFDSGEALLDCQFMYDTFRDVKNIFCDKVHGGLNGITVSLFVICVLLFFGYVFTVRGYKRFDKENHSDGALDDGDPGKVGYEMGATTGTYDGTAPQPTGYGAGGDYGASTYGGPGGYHGEPAAAPTYQSEYGGPSGTSASGYYGGPADHSQGGYDQGGYDQGGYDQPSGYDQGGGSGYAGPGGYDGYAADPYAGGSGAAYNAPPPLAAPDMVVQGGTQINTAQYGSSGYY